MKIEVGTYDLFPFLREVGITTLRWNRYKEECKKWLNQYFDYFLPKGEITIVKVKGYTEDKKLDSITTLTRMEYAEVIAKELKSYPYNTIPNLVKAVQKKDKYNHCNKEIERQVRKIIKDKYDMIIVMDGDEEGLKGEIALYKAQVNSCREYLNNKLAEFKEELTETELNDLEYIKLCQQFSEELLNDCNKFLKQKRGMLHYFKLKE